MGAYQIYQAKMLELGVGTDDWEDLDSNDKQAWTAVEEYYTLGDEECSF